MTSRSLIHILRSQAGHSLAETSVALAMLVTVLVPLSTVAAKLLAANEAYRTELANLLAQELMEETLAKQDFAPLDTLYFEGKWRGVRTIASVGKLTLIQIRVTPVNRAHISAAFTTLRIR